VILNLNQISKNCQGEFTLEKWITPARGELSRTELAEMKVHNTLFTVFYVQIVSMMKEKYGTQGAIDALRQIGEGVATTLYNYIRPIKTNSLAALISYIVDFAFYYPVLIKKIDDGLMVYDKNCPICWEGVIEKDIPYCCIVDGFLEKYIAMTHEENSEIPIVEVHVVKSKATGEKYCQHKVKLQSIYYSNKTKD
jgi:predicted hydrocarbon binding protein